MSKALDTRACRTFWGATDPVLSQVYQVLSLIWEEALRCMHPYGTVSSAKHDCDLPMSHSQRNSVNRQWPSTQNPCSMITGTPPAP